MDYPKVKQAEAIGDRILRVTFTNQEVRDYDIAQLLNKPMFAPLREPIFFKSFSIEPGGYGIVWNEEIDLSEYELWSNGTVPGTDLNNMADDETREVTTMSPLIAELMPAIAALSHADKFRLVQLVLAQLAQETGVEIAEMPNNNPPALRKTSRRGSLKHYAKPELIPQEQDAWQAVAREKHEHR